MKNKNIRKVKVSGSFGEQVIQGILDCNNVEYKKEYQFVNDDGRNQRMDFYVSYKGNNYCIEYHGEQHYKSIEFWGGNLEEVQKRDEIKKNYCEKRGILYRTIPYTQNTNKKIFDSLEDILEGLEEPESIIINKGVYIDIDEMLEYYETHSRKDTAKHYGLDEYRLGNLLVNINRTSKRVPTDIIKVYKFGEKVLEGTYHDIKNNLPDIEVKNLGKCLNGEMDATSDYTFSFVDKDREEVRLNNIKKRKDNYKNKNQLRRGSSKKKVILIDIFTEKEMVFNSVKECYEKTGLSKHKIYKLFNPNKDTNLVDKFVGKYNDGTMSMNIKEAKELYNKRLNK